MKIFLEIQYIYTFFTGEIKIIKSYNFKTNLYFIIIEMY